MIRYVFGHVLLSTAVLGGALLYAKLGPRRHRTALGGSTGLLVGQQFGALTGLLAGGPAGMLLGSMLGGVSGSIIGNEMALKGSSVPELPRARAEACA